MIRSTALTMGVLFAAAATASAGENVRDVLLAHEVAVCDAIKAGDSTRIRELLGEQAYCINEDGRQTASQLLANLEGMTLDAYRIADAKVVPLGDDAALLTYEFTWSGTMNGKTVTDARSYATSVWVNRDGQWRSTFYQETPINR